MKHEKLLTCFAATVFGAALGFGTAGCLITAFDLPAMGALALFFLCLLAAALTAAVCQVRHGGKLLMGILALAAVYLGRDGTAGDQFLNVLQRISVIYDRAYCWGYLSFPDEISNAGTALPPGILGSAVAIIAACTLCRKGSAVYPVLAVLLPLFSCVVVTDTVPGEGYLLLTMGGIFLLILTDSVRQENPAQGIRLITAAAIPVMLALTGLFLAVPQSGYVNQAKTLQQDIIMQLRRMPQVMEQGLTQIAARIPEAEADQVDLAGLGRRVVLTVPVMEVISDSSGILYLRGQDYDGYDGREWTSSPRSELFSPQSGRETTVTVRTKVRMDALYLPYYPYASILLTNGASVNTDNLTQYTLTRTALPDNWRQTVYLGQSAVRNPSLDDQSLSRYLSLPETTRSRAGKLLEGSFDANAGNTEKADIIAALVTESALYDLDPPKMPETREDFAIWFLEEGDRGYCVHFATASTVLLRSAGVPARYVTGYMVQTTPGQAVTVTGEHAHAWAEYYEPLLDAWIPLEATPTTDQTVLPETPPTQREPSESQTVPSAPEETAPVSPQKPSQPEPLPSEPALPQTPREPEKTVSPAAVYTLLLLLLIAVTLTGQRQLRLWLRRRRYHNAAPNALALLRWQEAERLSRLLKEEPPEALLELAQKAKFSRHTLSREELQQFEIHCRRCLRQLKARPWYLRLIYQYIHAAY